MFKFIKNVISWIKSIFRKEENIVMLRENPKYLKKTLFVLHPQPQPLNQEQQQEEEQLDSDADNIWIGYKTKFSLEDEFLSAIKAIIFENNFQAFFSLLTQKRKTNYGIFLLKPNEINFLNLISFLFFNKTLTREDWEGIEVPQQYSETELKDSESEHKKNYFKINNESIKDNIKRNSSHKKEIASKENWWIKLPEVFLSARNLFWEYISKNKKLNAEKYKKFHDEQPIRDDISASNSNRISSKLDSLEIFLSQDSTNVLSRFDLQGRLLIVHNEIFWSYDVINQDNLNKKFKEWLISGTDQQTEKPVLEAAWTKLIESNSRSSIIPLAEEMEMHLRLCLRTLEKTYKNVFRQEEAKGSNINWDTIREEACWRLNNEDIRKAYQECLLKRNVLERNQEGEIVAVNIKELNKALDKKRVKLAEKAKFILLEELKKDCNYNNIYQEKLELLNLFVLYMKNHNTLRIQGGKDDFYNQIIKSFLSTLVNKEENIKSKAENQYQEFLKEQIYNFYLAYSFGEIEEKKQKASSELILDFTKCGNNTDMGKAYEIVLKKLELLIKNEKSQKEKRIEKLLRKLNKHDFTSTTAISEDYIRTDSRNKNIIFISKTEETAHDKKIFDEDKPVLSLRVIETCQLQDNIVITNKRKQIKARVPSIALTHLTTEVAVQDVVKKLHHCYEVLAREMGDENYQGPMTYNLLTSLTRKVREKSEQIINPNNQRRSAKRILIGAHIFNAEQLAQGKINAMWFIQNIPVNQHGQPLTYNTESRTKSEAALMTEISLLKTFYHNLVYFPDDTQEQIKKSYLFTMASYKEFLQIYDVSKTLFKSTYEGKLVKEKIEQLKNSFKASILSKDSSFQSSETENLHVIVTQVLFRLFSKEKHFDLQYGMLVQSLSAFIENFAMIGCKSGNERTQSVLARMELLISIENRMATQSSFSKEELLLITTLKKFAAGNDDVNTLQNALDTACNAHTIYGAAAAIAPQCQGAAAKLLSAKNSTRGRIEKKWNTNVGETDLMQNLQQAHASKLQAHKANLGREFCRLGAELKIVRRDINISFFGSAVEQEWTQGSSNDALARIQPALSRQNH